MRRSANPSLSGQARRSGDRNQSHAEPRRLHRRSRHRARPRRDLIGTLKDKIPKPLKGDFPCPVKVSSISARRLTVSGIRLRLVRGVKNGPSPEWLQKRLTAIGLRPINALVDITNFITFDRAPAVACVRRRKVQGNLDGARAKKGREAAGARRQDATRSTRRCA